MKKNWLACLALVCVTASACAQKVVLSIEDALKISKMNNMKEASAVLRDYGYKEISEDPFYSREVASFWVKGCEVEPGINCITTVGVSEKSSSSVAVLASHYDRWIEICVHESSTRDMLIKQIKELDFRNVGKDEYGDSIYAKGTDTVKLSIKNREIYYFIDPQGNKEPVLYTVISDDKKEPAYMTSEEWKDYFTYADQWYTEKGYILVRKDDNSIVYSNGEEEMKFLKGQDEIWDGYYTFNIPHNNHWPNGVDHDIISEENYGPTQWSTPEIPEMEIVEEEEQVEEVPFFRVEERPKFEGNSFDRFPIWVNKNLSYPKSAIKKKIQGTVRARFVVGRDGKLSPVEIVQSPDDILSEEVVRVVTDSPKWTPAKVYDRSVEAIFELPVHFVLRDVQEEEIKSEETKTPEGYVDAGGVITDDNLIEGLVLDVRDNSPVVGVSVFDTDNVINGTRCGIDGRFKLRITPSTKSITVSRMGYEDIITTPAKNMVFHIKPEVIVLDEIAVVAYSN